MRTDAAPESAFCVGIDILAFQGCNIGFCIWELAHDTRTFRLFALLEWLVLMRRQIAAAAARFCNIEMMYPIQVCHLM
jgi:hypothetical protein